MTTETMQAMSAEAIALGRKYEVTDIQAMSVTQRTFLMGWAREYKGTFDYMISMREQAIKGSLTVSQLKGIANCFRADALRNQKPTIIGKPVVSNEGTIDHANAAHVLKNGYYTVKMIDGHVTIRVSNSFRAKQANGNSNMKGDKGTQVAAMLVGPNNESDYRSQCLIEGDKIKVEFSGAATRGLAAVDFLLGHPEKGNEMGMLYAKTSGNCYRCGRTLTDPDSIEAGIGPICQRY